MTEKDDDALLRAVTGTSSAVDEAITDIDLLKIADAVGVVRGGPSEPSGEHLADLARRQRAAKRRAQGIDRRRAAARSLDRYLDTSPYPDPAHPTEDQLRQLANDLVQFHGFDPEYLMARYGLTRRNR